VSPARKAISEELIDLWIEEYLLDMRSISEIARSYGHHRHVVKSRMEERHPGITSEWPDPTPADPPPGEPTGSPEASDFPRHDTNGHGDPLDLA
jgi:hypothetical protein